MTDVLARHPVDCAQKMSRVTARIIDDRELWIAATAHNEYFGTSALAWFEQNIELDWQFNCWRWTGWKSKGYGAMFVGRQSWAAHRFSYELHRGSAFGLHLDHLCRNTWCVNPWHLEPISNSANARRSKAFRSRNQLDAAARRGFEAWKARR